ncbi:unnamed protein product [Trichogramma brassicae]|uniref:CCHC-type domain-containing protein n=1 Tax=Trichogramma brassicae TaxID=86971 RepID=A0A6H5J0V9_9HYME|nr:unnamed protein product [Trichogramma brassicae]
MECCAPSIASFVSPRLGLLLMVILSLPARTVIGVFFTASEADDIARVFFLSGTRSTSGTGSTTPGEKTNLENSPSGDRTHALRHTLYQQARTIPTEPRRPIMLIGKSSNDVASACSITIRTTVIEISLRTSQHTHAHTNTPLHCTCTEQQAPKSGRDNGTRSRSKSGSVLPLPTKIRSSPSMIAEATTRKILGAPLVTTKDAPLLALADIASGSYEEKWARIEGLVSGLAGFIEPKGNLHKEIGRYTASLVQAVSAFTKTKKSLGPAQPSTADKTVCTSPIFTVGATSKRPAMSPPVTRATPKRYAATAASRQPDENNNDAVDQDGFVLVAHRRHRQRNQPVTTVGSARPRQQPKPRPAQRRVHHRPDAIVIKAKDASTYADILQTLKSDTTLQQSVGSSVQNIRRSAAGALVLQLKKNVEYASTLGAELDKVLGDTATASALQHTTMIEIRDLDECSTKDEIAEALSTSLSAPHINKTAVKTLRKAYAGTQVAVAALPDDLAAKALKLGHIRISWVNCRIRGREDTLHCYRCWSPGHVSARCKGPDRSAHCFRCGQTGHRIMDFKNYLTVYAPPRLADVEFYALLTNIIEKAWIKRPFIVAGDFDAWATERGCRVTRQRATILLDALATLEAALLNTGDTPTFTGALGYSVIDLTFASHTLAPRITSWAVSELYTHSDHQAIVFEIETARPPRPTTRQSCKRNARTLDTESLSVMIANAAVPPRLTGEMATRLMAAITSACDASIAKSSRRRRRCAVYWWTSEIADLRRSCLRARRLAQRARARPNEGTCRESYASTRRLLRTAIKTSKRL